MAVRPVRNYQVSPVAVSERDRARSGNPAGRLVIALTQFHNKVELLIPYPSHRTLCPSSHSQGPTEEPMQLLVGPLAVPLEVSSQRGRCPLSVRGPMPQRAGSQND